MHKAPHGPAHSTEPGRPLVRLKLRHGHFLDNAPDDVRAVHLERMRAALPHMGPTSYFARSSAALIHGLPVFSADLDRLHRVHTDGGHGQRSWISHSYKTPLKPPKTSEVDGFPVTSLGRTAADLMRRTFFGPALAIADSALRLGCDRRELLTEVKGGRGCRHSTEAALRADARSESPYESLVRATILQAGLPMPTLQFEFFDKQGRFLGRSDFYWPEHKLVGEFDGKVKLTTLLAPGETPEDVLARQDRRQRRIEALGNDFVRWTSADVHAPGAIVESLRRFLGDARVDHGMCPEAHDYRRPRYRGGR